MEKKKIDEKDDQNFFPIVHTTVIPISSHFSGLIAFLRSNVRQKHHIIFFRNSASVKFYSELLNTQGDKLGIKFNVLEVVDYYGEKKRVSSFSKFCNSAKPCLFLFRGRGGR